MKSNGKGDIISLDKNEIFVFGSNLQGIHGKGAANIARRFGAKMGVGEGLVGSTYAFPTVRTLYPYKVIPLSDYPLYIGKLMATAIIHKDLTFYMTRVGCGLAGNKDSNVAPLFSKLAKLSNVIFPEQWGRFLQKAKTYK